MVTRTVAAAKGKIAVPSTPRRVIAIAPQARGTRYDLGVIPVGGYDEGARYISPRYRAKVAGAAIVGTGRGAEPGEDRGTQARSQGERGFALLSRRWAGVGPPPPGDRDTDRAADHTNRDRTSFPAHGGTATQVR